MKFIKFRLWILLWNCSILLIHCVDQHTHPFYNYPLLPHDYLRSSVPYNYPPNFGNYLPGYNYANPLASISKPVAPTFARQFNPYTNESALRSRDPRLLSLFTIIQFSKYDCTTTSGVNGTCLTPVDCLAKGGIPFGPCAKNFGICCVKMATCGQSIHDNGTYFVNKGYPNAYNSTGSCQMTLHKIHPDICQYRLEFDYFSIVGPEPMNHICNYDQMIITGTNGIPVICGYNTGQHNAGNNPIVLTLVTSGPHFPRRWKIRITQVPCVAPDKADNGCLQYHTGVSGSIKSFNYHPDFGQQLSNQDYTICLRTEKNFCSVQYTQCDDRGNNRSQSFTLSGNTSGENSVESVIGTTGENACNMDWLMIPCISNSQTLKNGISNCIDRICGGTLNTDVTTLSSPIYSSVKPFRLSYHTNNVEAPNDSGNRGFCLNYIQQPCNSYSRFSK